MLIRTINRYSASDCDLFVKKYGYELSLDLKSYLSNNGLLINNSIVLEIDKLYLFMSKCFENESILIPQISDAHRQKIKLIQKMRDEWSGSNN